MFRVHECLDEKDFMSARNIAALYIRQYQDPLYYLQLAIREGKLPVTIGNNAVVLVKAYLGSKEVETL